MKRTMFRYLKKELIYIVLSILMAFFSVILTLAVPIIMGKCIDLIAGRHDVNFDMLKVYTLWLVIIILVNSMITWIMNIINNKITYTIMRDVRNDAFLKLTKLPLKYTDSHRTGEITSMIIQDTESLGDGLLMGFTQAFTGIITIVGTLVYMFILNVKIALAVMFITPLSLVVANFIAKKTYIFFRGQSLARGEATAYIEEMLGNLKVVKAFTREDESIAKFDGLNENLKKNSFKAIFYSSLTNPSTRFVNSVVYAVVALMGCFMAMDDLITVGAIATFLSYANQYTKPFNEISGVITELQNAFACAKRVFALIEEEPEVDREDTGFVPKERRIEISHVDFAYTKEQKLITDFNLSVEYGKKVAIVGPTGCGKTTLINLLMRFYDVRGGSITIDGTDIRDISRDELRSMFGMVLQDTWLRSGTIRDNIRFAREDATDEEIVAAAKLSRAHSFIKRLPQGYDTVITEEGEGLSQGQKQLLCITRIMLLDPAFLILDEATSSIDTRTEIQIQNAFDTLTKGRTSFIVAHRLSTIMNADIILVMKDGNVIEQGTHDELMKLGGFYSELHKSATA